MKVSVAINGVDETLRKLSTFRDSTQKKLLAQALTPANAIARKNLRESTPKQSGLLRRSMTSQTRRYKRGSFGISGQDMAKVKGDTKNLDRFSKRSRARRIGGIPGRYGSAAPSHLIEGSVKPHRIPSRKASLGQVNTFWRGKGRGGAQVFTSGINHPGLAGTRFIAKANRRSQGPMESAFYRRLKVLIDKELDRAVYRREQKVLFPQ